MVFRLVSQQLTVEEGEVSFSRELASTEALTDLRRSVRVTMNETEDVQGVTPGRVHLLCINCVVRSRVSGVSHRVSVLRLTASVSDREIITGITDVPLGFHAFARIEAVDVNGQPLTREHLVGVCLPWMSIEVKGPSHAPLYALLPPGEYVAYLGGERPVQVPFVISDLQEDAGTISVRESGI